MSPILKLVLFFVVAYGLILAGYKTYIRLNERIKSSQTGLELLGFSLLLFAVNTALFFGGLLALIKLYDFLS